MLMTADELKIRLQLDFAAEDLGDSASTYTTRMNMIAADAVAREGVTDAQRAEGARYLLLSAQLRALGREVEEFRAEGEITVKQGLEVRMGQLRREQQTALALSGLAASNRSARIGSISVPVGVSF